MGETKHQHLVPVCYLANFGINGNEGRNSTVFYCDAFDSSSYENPRIISVNKFPVENCFYDIPLLDTNKKLLEEFFCQIEGEYSEQLKLILQYVVAKREKTDALRILSTPDKNKLAMQFALQIVRTRVFRNHYQRIYDTLSHAFLYADIPKYEKADFQRLHTNELLDFKMANFYANLLSDRNWVFLINHTDLPFFTSDNPAIFINNSRKNVQNLSPASPETTFFIPLSPQIAIELYSKSILKEAEKFFDIYKRETVRWYNMNLKINSARFMMSNQKDFSCLAESGGIK